MEEYVQISLFTPQTEAAQFPCETCGYDVTMCCNYPDTKDDYCVLGDKWKPKTLDYSPGDYVEDHGPELTFEEITQMTGQLIVMDCSTRSHDWYKVVRVERIVQTSDGRRLVYYDGKKQNGLVSEIYFASGGWKYEYPARAYRLED